VAAEPERLSWTPVRGSAVEMSVGADGAVFALDADGRVWLRRPGDANTSWLRLPGSFKRIDAASQKLAWAVDAEGVPYRYNGTWWRPVEGRARDVGVGADGTAFVVTAEGKLVRHDVRRGFVEVADAPDALARVDVDEQGRPWVVRENGEAHRFDGQRWHKLPGTLADISVGGGMAYGKGADGQLLRWRAEAGRWTAVAARVVAVAANADGKPWIATADGSIFANDPDTRKAKRGRAEAPAQVFTQIVNWKRVRGNAKELAISGGGAILALGTNGKIWQWKGKDNWGRLPGTLTRIALEPSGLPWGVDAESRVLQYLGGYWKPFGGTARDIAIGAEGSMWIVQMDGVPAQWDRRAREWRPAEPATKAARIAVDPEGKPWIVAGDGSVSRHDGKTWVATPGVEAKSIAIGPEGSVYAAGVDKRPWRYDRTAKRWEYINGDVAAIAVGPRGQPWVATSQADIYASSFFEEQREAPPVQIAATATKPPSPAGTAAIATSKEPLGISSFQLIRNFTGRDIAIGNDGSVFALAFDGTLARWNNAQNRFLVFPGVFSRIAVAADGKPWGVTGRNEVWRHDGTIWRAVLNVQAQDIAIGLDGTVIVAAPDEVLYRYIASEDRFERMLPAREGDPAPAGSRIAVDPQGRPWTITRDNVLWRCDRQPCERMPQAARDVDIGPEGSVFIADMEHRLRRLDPATGEWSRIGVDADVVAVGPGGKPWIVNGRSEAWSSAKFKRDESNDIVKAASSSTAAATSATSAPPVFTFTVSMPFDQVPLPAGFTVNGWPGIQLAIGPGGKLVVIDGVFAFWNYDETRKILLRDTAVPSPASVVNSPTPGEGIRRFVIGTDGTYWITRALETNITPKIWRRQGSQWIEVPGLDDCASTPGCGSPSTMSVAIGLDGAVYATSSGNSIYRYDTTLLRFVKLNMPLPSGAAAFVTVDPNGRFWVASPAPALLHEYVGNAWIKRTDSVIGAPFQCLFLATPCTSIGANGSAYGFGAVNKMVRWNATAGVWETITSTPPGMNVSGWVTYVAAPDGRLWVWTGALLYRTR